jgi:hypothetical protein
LFVAEKRTDSPVPSVFAQWLNRPTPRLRISTCAVCAGPISTPFSNMRSVDRVKKLLKKRAKTQAQSPSTPTVSFHAHPLSLKIDAFDPKGEERLVDMDVHPHRWASEGSLCGVTMKSIAELQAYADHFKPLLEGQLCGRCAKPVSTDDDLVILYFSKDDGQPFESVNVNHWTCVYPPWQGEIPF